MVETVSGKLSLALVASPIFLIAISFGLLERCVIRAVNMGGRHKAKPA
jgi:hypothetical protein